MATFVLETEGRNAACDGFVDDLDAGGGAGYLKFETAADGEVAVLPFSATSFGNAGASNPGEAISAAITSDTTTTAGTVAQVSLFDFADAKKGEADCTAVGGGGSFTLTSLTVGDNETISIALGGVTVTMPAS